MYVNQHGGIMMRWPMTVNAAPDQAGAWPPLLLSQIHPRQHLALFIFFVCLFKLKHVASFWLHIESFVDLFLKSCWASRVLSKTFLETLHIFYVFLSFFLIFCRVLHTFLKKIHPNVMFSLKFSVVHVECPVFMSRTGPENVHLGIWQ